MLYSKDLQTIEERPFKERVRTERTEQVQDMDKASGNPYSGCSCHIEPISCRLTTVCDGGKKKSYQVLAQSKLYGTVHLGMHLVIMYSVTKMSKQITEIVLNHMQL